MSLLQEESSPRDDFLNYSITKKQNCIKYTEKVEKQEEENHKQHQYHQSGKEDDEPKTAIGSPLYNSIEQPLSSARRNETIRNEPIATLEKDLDAAACNAKPKSAFSYQNIHSEYTKHRYRHVESKVRQYIASIKAAEKKRHQRNGGKFLRHSSMPDTLGNDDDKFSTDAALRKPMYFSETDLPRMSPMESLCDSDEMNSTTTSMLSTSQVDQNQRPQCKRHRNANSNEVALGVLNQKLAYLLEQNEYLQSRLEEKMDEIMRHKHNEDYLRIELTNLQDKLKEQKQKEEKLQAALFDSKLRCYGKSQQMQQAFRQSKALITVSTQTESHHYQPLGICTTSNMLDVNNNDLGITSTATTATIATNTSHGKKTKNIAAIHPISYHIGPEHIVNHQHSNSRHLESGSRDLLRYNLMPTARPNYSSGGARNCDSGIDIEAVTMVPDTDYMLSGNAKKKCTLTPSSSSSPSRCHCWLRLLGACTHCSKYNNRSVNSGDHGGSSRNSNSISKQSYTYIPFLGKSFENCRNVR